MTMDKMDVHALIGKTADGDFLREMIGFAAQRLMEMEVGGLTGAAYGEKDLVVFRDEILVCDEFR